MKVSNIDFQAEYKILKVELDKAYEKVMESGRYILGTEVSDFQKEFANFCESRYCVGVGNGLDALQLGLRALGVGNGDEVIVPSNTYIASWIAISLTGATPVPVEPDENTYNINPELIERSITKKTKAVMPVHLYGQPADMTPIRELAEKYNIRIIDDAAQAHGAKYKGKKIGTLADITAFSFYPTKNLGAIGDGGCITTNDPELAKMVETLRNYGESEKYKNDIIGFNSRLDELQAAFLRVKLRHLAEINKRKAEIASRYLSEISNDSLSLPYVPEYVSPVWHQFVIKSKYRDELKKYLFYNGVNTLIHYPIPPHLQRAYGYANLNPDDLILAAKLAKDVLSLPISWTMNDEQIQYVINVINKKLPT
ncbi:MAG: DegT/DnrJ/EryC1/StrS family aminotransferase [Thermoplasmatales archaeon]